MRILLSVIVIVLFIDGHCENSEAPGLPPPPSVAIDPPSLPLGARPLIMIGGIPPAAKFINYAQLKLEGFSVPDEPSLDQVREVSGLVEQLIPLASGAKANLIVLIPSKTGIRYPLPQNLDPLILPRNEPTVTALFFYLESGSELGYDARFTSHAPDKEKESIKFSIDLVKNTTGLPLSYWFYGNISRFIQEAKNYGFDSIYVESTDDTDFEPVWLPFCDEPVRISNRKPSIQVSVYKSEEK